MKLGKHTVKVLAVFAVLFVVGFALKFLNLHEGFVNFGDGTIISASKYKEKQTFMKDVRNAANERDIKGRKRWGLIQRAKKEAGEARLEPIGNL